MVIKLKARELIDPEREAHFSYHKKFKYWTIEHSHDFYEMFLITDGSLYHIVNGQRQTLSVGTLVFIRPHDIHSYEKHQSGDAELLNINFRIGAIHKAFKFLGEGFHPERLTHAKLPMSQSLSTTATHHLIEQYSQITNIPSHLHAEIRTHVRALLVELLITYFSPQQSPPTPNAPPWLNKIQLEMLNKENFAEGLLALYKLSPVTPEHLSRTLRKHLGVTPTEWINEMRLNYAANLLRYSNEEILTVSLESGFNNLSHFYELFSLRYQVSPAKYRKANRRIVIPE